MRLKVNCSTVVGCALLSLCLSQAAKAQVPAAPNELGAPIGVLNLEANANVEVTNDTAIYMMFTEQEAAEGPKASEGALRTINEALKVVKAEAQTGSQAPASTQVRARVGGISTYPNYTQQGKVSGWRSRAELVLESTDFNVLSKLVGKLGAKLQVGSVNFTLSRELRAQTEQQLIQQAVAGFQQKAQVAAKALGYSNYSIREVTLGSPSNGPRPPVAYLAKASARDSAEVSGPVEGGQSTVIVSVNGSVQMTR